ncbi:MAG: hypothetical protein QF464_03170, partial [Myxococcota bacterium]|nr:hypothetical protein [Myxococcota bacterium]
CSPVEGCLSGQPLGCDDEDPCTDDSCDPALGCEHTHNTAPCDDEDPCTEEDTCSEGECVGGPQVDCSSYDAECLIGVCDSETGLCGALPLPDGTSCDDDNACTEEDACLDGACTAYVSVSCDDANLCTDEACYPEQGCVSTPNSEPCDDGLWCTEDDTCEDSVCVGQTERSCPSADDCFAGVCDDSIDECALIVQEDYPCDDEDPCTGEGVCDESGVCVIDEEEQDPCDDGDPCTVDSCDPETGECTSIYDPLLCECEVEITACESLCVDKETTLEAIEYPWGGTLSWEIIEGTDKVTPTSGTGPSLTIQGVEASDSMNDVKAVVTYVTPYLGCQAECKLTVCEADLVIHMPKVIDAGETAIPEKDEVTKGAQTFVNLDNDDKSAKYDIDESPMTTEDDELVALDLKIRPKDLDSGQARLDVTGGLGTVKLWKDAKKAASYTSGTALAVPDDFEVKDGWLVKRLWAEGTQAHTTQRAAQFKLTYEGLGATCEDEAALTVIGVQSLRWLGKLNGFGGTAHTSNVLGGDPNFTGTGPSYAGLSAVRVFPGGRPGSTSVFRDTVRLQVTLSVAPANGSVDVYVRPFDVDDPLRSARVDPNDWGSAGTYFGTGINYTAEEDNRGAVSGYKEGKFIPQAGLFGKLTFPAGATSRKITFKTTHHPGDNYAAVANGDKDFLAELRNKDKDDGPLIVDKKVTGSTAVARKLKQYAQYVSPTLTAWRILHVERDSMTSIPIAKNRAVGFAESLLAGRRQLGLYTQTLRLNDKLTKTLDDGSPRIGDSPGNGTGRFTGGRFARLGSGAPGVGIAGNGNFYFRLAAPWAPSCVLTLPGVGKMNCTVQGFYRFSGASRVVLTPLTIAANTFKNGTITVAGVTVGVKSHTKTVVTTKSRLMLPFRAYDDDDLTLLPHPTLADTSLMAQGFHSSYVLPVNDGGGSGSSVETNNVSSVVNVAKGQAGIEGAQQRASVANESDAFWGVYILSSYQYHTLSDFDPNPNAPRIKGQPRQESGTGGVAWSATSNTVLARGGEGCLVFRETSRDRVASGKAQAGHESRATVHEVGHQFGLKHDTGIMRSSNSQGPLGAAFTFNRLHQHFIRSRVHSPGK